MKSIQLNKNNTAVLLFHFDPIEKKNDTEKVIKMQMNDETAKFHIK